MQWQLLKCHWRNILIVSWSADSQLLCWPSQRDLQILLPRSYSVKWNWLYWWSWSPYSSRHCCVSCFDRADPGINPSEILPHTRSLLILIQLSLQRLTSVLSPKEIKVALVAMLQTYGASEQLGKHGAPAFLMESTFPLPTAFCKTVQSLLPAFRELLATGKCLWKEWAGRHPNSRSHKLSCYLSPSSSFYTECWDYLLRGKITKGIWIQVSPLHLHDGQFESSDKLSIGLLNMHSLGIAKSVSSCCTLLLLCPI